MPFVPPPAKEAPYRALPHTDFSLRFKMKICWWVYLRWQCIGIAFFPFMIGAFWLSHPNAFLHNSIYRNHALFFSLYMTGMVGVLGIASAMWKYLMVTISDHQARPPR